MEKRDEIWKPSQGRSEKGLRVVTEERGGIFRSFYEGRGNVVGFGATEKESVFNLRSFRQ